MKWWISVILGRKKLPSAEEMRHHTEMDLQKKLDLGWKNSHAHKLMYFLKDYWLEELGFTIEEEPWIDTYIEVTFDIFLFIRFYIITNSHFKLLELIN